MSKKAGRPTKYSPELAAGLCADIAYCEEEARPLLVHEACRRHGVIISSFFLWLKKHPEFSDAYAHARDIRYEIMAEEVLAIPDALPSGICWQLPDGRRFLKLEDIDEDEQGRAKLIGLSKEEVLKAQLQCASRQWYLAKLLPHKFGNKVDLTHKGDKENPIAQTVVYLPANGRETK